MKFKENIFLVRNSRQTILSRPLMKFVRHFESQALGTNLIKSVTWLSSRVSSILFQCPEVYLFNTEFEKLFISLEHKFVQVQHFEISSPSHNAGLYLHSKSSKTNILVQIQIYFFRDEKMKSEKCVISHVIECFY